MHRVTRLLAVTCAAAALLTGRDSVANVEFNFNSTQEGWTFGTIQGSGTDTPYWFFEKASSKDNGGLQAFLLASGANAGAWALSPCMEVKKNDPTIDIDFSHYTLFSSTDILGQVQFRVDTTGTGFGLWQGVPSIYWNGPTTVCGSRSSTATCRAIFSRSSTCCGIAPGPPSHSSGSP